MKVQEEQTKQGFLPLADICFQFLNPILRKKMGIGVQILENWSEIVGKELSKITYPFKINWPPQKKNGRSEFVSGTLVVACEARAGIIMQHNSDNIIQSLERILGPSVVNRIRIITRSISREIVTAKPEWHINKEEEKFLNYTVSGIENKELRQVLFNIGKIIIAENSKKDIKKRQHHKVENKKERF